MSDQQMESLISAYCDGELNAAERARAEELLATSAEARAELDSYRQMSTLMREARQVRYQANLTAGVMQAIQQPAANSKTTVTPNQKSDKSRSAQRMLSMVAASVACLAFLLWLGLNGGGKPNLANNEENKNPNQNAVDPTPVAPETVKSIASQTEKTPAAVIAQNTPKTVIPAIPENKVAAKPLEANQLPVKLIADLKNSNVGTIQRFIRENQDGGVTVFHLMVMDIKPGMESLELILSAQQISGVDGKPVSNSSDVVAVYIEAKQDKMDALVEHLKEEHAKFLALGMQHNTLPSEQIATLSPKRTGDASQAVPVNDGDLKRIGVAPLKTEEIAMARSQIGRKDFKAAPKSFANSATKKPGINESPMLKLLILVEKATPESLLNQPN